MIKRSAAGRHGERETCGRRREADGSRGGKSQPTYNSPHCRGRCCQERQGLGHRRGAENEPCPACGIRDAAFCRRPTELCPVVIGALPGVLGLRAMRGGGGHHRSRLVAAFIGARCRRRFVVKGDIDAGRRRKREKRREEKEKPSRAAGGGGNTQGFSWRNEKEKPTQFGPRRGLRFPHTHAAARCRCPGSFRSSLVVVAHAGTGLVG